MESLKSWKDYSDEWNTDVYSLDNANKLLVIDSTDNQVTISVNTDSPDEKIVTNNAVIISLNDVLEIIKLNNFNSINDLVILDNIIKVLGWAINNCDVNADNYTNFVNAISWICKCVDYFTKELGIPEIINKPQFGLIRSSYKLCPQKSNCIYQYPDNINNNSSCKYQHYPYANLSIDCMSIINYINSFFSNYSSTQEDTSKTTKLIIALTKNNLQDKEFNTSELKRCLTTINFVFMIMFRELETIDKCRKHETNYDIRKYHCYHAPFKFTEKKGNMKHRKYI